MIKRSKKIGSRVCPSRVSDNTKVTYVCVSSINDARDSLKSRLKCGKLFFVKIKIKTGESVGSTGKSVACKTFHKKIINTRRS